MVRGEVEPGQRAQRSHRFRVDAHDLGREASRGLGLPVLEHRVDGTAVVPEGSTAIVRPEAEVARTVEGQPSESQLGRLRLGLEIRQLGLVYGPTRP